MNTNSQPVKTEREGVLGPSWLRVKSQIKAGPDDKSQGFGGDRDNDPSSPDLVRLTTCATRSGGVRARCGESVQPIRPERDGLPGPTWLQVKTRLRAGGDDPVKQGFGPANGDEGQSSTLLRVTDRVKQSAHAIGSRAHHQLPLESQVSEGPAWLRVKSHIRAGGDDPVKPGMGPGDGDEGRSSTLVLVTDRVRRKLNAIEPLA
jgi:hypothetical protein